MERFRNINETFGRAAGDALLRQVAEVLTHLAGDAALLARVGGDQFAAVLPEVKRGVDVPRLLDRIAAAFLEHPFRLNEAVFRIAARAGGALFPDDGVDADTLYRNAEAALKRAKKDGERFVFYTQGMTEAVAGKLTMESQLRDALSKGEFVLHYQPKVNLASGRITGTEALIRWNDPRTAGLVPPMRFIPILEETGLIHERRALGARDGHRGLPALAGAGLPAVRVAVNVSPLQLRSRGFIDEIGEVVGRDPHAAAGLELEITESLIMEDVKHSIATLQAIRAMGVKIAIDDFGTGFSSLSYLSRLPVDTLKIDRSFVIGHDGRAGGSFPGLDDHQPGALAEAQRRGGGGRNRGAVAPAPAAGMRRDAGLPLQQGGAGGALRIEVPGPASRLKSRPGKRTGIGLPRDHRLQRGEEDFQLASEVGERGGRSVQDPRPAHLLQRERRLRDAGRPEVRGGAAKEVSRALDAPCVSGFDEAPEVGERFGGLRDEEVHELPEEAAVAPDARQDRLGIQLRRGGREGHRNGWNHLRAARQPGHHLQDVGGAQGLRQVVVHPRRQAGLPVSLQRTGREGDDRYVPARHLFFGPDRGRSSRARPSPASGRP